MTKTVQSRQGDTVDLICWRHYGRTSGAAEAVFGANPGIADVGAVLPFGTTVILPDLDLAKETATTTVSLWD
ncbi:MAG: phage tail protein [Proteobacteria bacterium]|nr:phage tail protein [Pseudomonadota bacterium]